jgi:aspartate-semialdehyde dehydrogenase
LTPAAKERPRVAVVGGETPLGADLRELLAGSILGGRVKLVGSEDSDDAILTEQGGEPVVITAMDAGELNTARVVFMAGAPAATRKAYSLIEPGPDRPMLVDLTRALEELPEAHLRAPSVEPPSYLAPKVGLAVVAHPAAILLASLINCLHQAHAVRQAVATVFEPTSERGVAGIHELQQQTVNLLSFQPLPKAIFDEQLAFNVLAAYGEEAAESLASIEQRIEKHLATLLAHGDGVPMPSLRVLQAPVMHGHSVSLWVEFLRTIDLKEIEGALAAAGMELRSEAPTAVGMAAQSGIAVGALETDRNHRHALWLFSAADNYRLAAENALAIARNELIRSGG